MKHAAQPCRTRGPGLAWVAALFILIAQPLAAGTLTITAKKRDGRALAENPLATGTKMELSARYHLNESF
jgi:hypothetical protein